MARRFGVCGVPLVAALLLAPGGAQAATVLGQTTGTPFNDNCTTAMNPYTEVQVATGSPPSYTVPAGGGVITSWSHQGGPNETGDLKLKVYRPTMNPAQYTVVGSSQQTMAANTLTTTNTQIPVQAGDTLGYTRLVGSVMWCLIQTANAGDMIDDAPSADTADGNTTTFSAPGSNLRINISAVLEPDGDADGLGDESQDNDDDNDAVADVNDNCPTQAGPASNGGCPLALSNPPAKSKKKCKKRKARAVSSKKCKKRKKRKK
jgi:hypothetical protein